MIVQWNRRTVAVTPAMRLPQVTGSLRGLRRNRLKILGGRKPKFGISKRGEKVRIPMRMWLSSILEALREKK